MNLLGKAADKASGVLHKNHIYNYSYNKKKSELKSCLVAAQSISPGSDVDSGSKPITITCIPYKDLDRLTLSTLDSNEYPEVLSVSGNKEFKALVSPFLFVTFALFKLKILVLPVFLLILLTLLLSL